jgi:hypothetical protein
MEFSSRLAARRRERLAAWGNAVVVQRNVGTCVEIHLLGENAYLRGADDPGPSEVVVVSLRPSLVDDPTFSLSDLCAILAHEIGHAAAGPTDFDADQFAKSVVGKPASIRALRRYRDWCKKRDEPIDEAKIDARIARLQRDC